MPCGAGRPFPASPSRRAHPLLADWLETGPVVPDGLRRALVLGDPAGAELLARRVPAAQVGSDRETPADGERYDLVAAVRVPGGDADPAALAAAVADGGTLLLIEPADGNAGIATAAARLSGTGTGMQLTAFDDLSGTGADPAGRPRRWLRATFRRGSR